MGTVLHQTWRANHWDSDAVSVPFSMGTVLHHRLAWDYSQAVVAFQSPSRWGRCCIGILHHIADWCLSVSVPFSMGTVLHLDFFALGTRVARVSVPFSMGTVLHRRAAHCLAATFASFSPLLDGDGVASISRFFSQGVVVMFQSPSRWGRCCIVGVCASAEEMHKRFQSPSRWGRCCIEMVDRASYLYRKFQSPSRWGRCCICCGL